MTADLNPNDLPTVLEQLQHAEPDVLRSMLTVFVQALMSADADAACGAEFGARSPDRVNRRNGYRSRDWDTRAGTLELAIPKLREGSYSPDWLLERRKRTERALISVVATSYLLGVSTRRMEKLVQTLGITRLSKSQVSIMAKDLDAQVEAFRTRPLDAGDLLHFLDAVRVGRLLTPELTHQFLTPQVARDAHVSYGFGLEFRHSTLYKEGSNAGVSALITRYREADADAVVLSNTDGAAWPVMAELNRRYES